MDDDVIITKYLGRQPYTRVWQLMQQFTDTRTLSTADEIWFLEHDPVFTQGQAGKAEHILNPGNIPVVQTDRGGQVTYHGPGQLIAYCLIDIKRRKLGVRTLVSAIEAAIINTLDALDIKANARPDAPGVYIDKAKIASLGLRIRKGCSYHGLSFNIEMDLSPFKRINPCGMQHLPITQLHDFHPDITIAEVMPLLRQHLLRQLSHRSSVLASHQTNTQQEKISDE